MVYDMQQTLIVACFPAFPLKNLIQAIPYSVQLNSSSSQNLLVCGLLQIILTIFFKSNLHDLLSVLLLLHKKEK